MSSLTHESKTGATIELQGTSMQLKEHVLDLQATIFRLKKENQELKEKIKLQENTEFNKKMYFCYSDEVPFCPNCFKDQGLLTHLVGPVQGDSGHVYNCPNCNKAYRMETK